MSTIVYCFYVPEHDQAGNLKPRPPNVLRWFATYPGDDQPVEFGVIPYLINTRDEQVALRTLAGRAHEVIGLQILKPDVRPFISRVVPYGDEMPMTWVMDSFKSTGDFVGLGQSHGLEIGVRPGDNVLLRNQIRRLEQYPFNKCFDQVQAARVKKVIELRGAGVRGLPFVKNPRDTASCTVLHLETFKRVMQDKPDQPSEYPLTALEFIKASKLPPKPKPKSLDSAQSRPPEHYAQIQTVTVVDDEPPISPPRPPDDRIHDAAEPARRYWWNNDN